MLEAFIQSNRDLIVARAQERAAARMSPQANELVFANGLPMFLDQLCVALRLARVSDEVDHDQIGKSAGRHGHDLLRMGRTIAQVVHDYGDVCQTVTELAVEQNADISSAEFRTLNLCLDDAIAQAVTAYSHHREQAISDHGTERLGVLAHELRNLLNTAMLAFGTLKSGRVAIGGSTGLLLGRSLMGLRDLVDRSMASVRLEAGIERVELIAVSDFVEEVEIAAIIEADSRGMSFATTPVSGAVSIEGDRQILAGAVANLLQNAFKFTHPGGHVSLTTVVTPDRVLFEIEDECGGLPPGGAEGLFRPYEQRSANRSGLGLGLSVSQRAAKASSGELRVRDLPGKGCVFTLDLPRKTTPSSASF